MKNQQPKDASQAGSIAGAKEKHKNEPYTGQYNATVRDCRLPGVDLTPREKVYLLPETLSEQKDEVIGWTIGVVREKNPGNEPVCVPLRLLNLSDSAKLEIRNLVQNKTAQA